MKYSSGDVKVYGGPREERKGKGSNSDIFLATKWGEGK